MSDALTTEKLRKLFKNNFDLCNFSINIARNMIRESQPAPLAEVLEAVAHRASDEK